MPANWSLILNALLLIGVVIAIGRLIKSKRKNMLLPSHQMPSLGGPINDMDLCDDIIAVRKINPDLSLEQELSPVTKPLEKATETAETHFTFKNSTKQVPSNFPQGKYLMMFLLAKDNRQMVGYELLQTLLAAGLRFGEGSLFHRHQHANGKGPVLCSLAAATASGIFDLQNMGTFSAKGLCLFMQTSGNPTIDEERFTVMHETAKHLRDSLDAQLLDERRQPLGPASIARYHRTLSISEPQEA